MDLHTVKTLPPNLFLFIAEHLDNLDLLSLMLTCHKYNKQITNSGLYLRRKISRYSSFHQLMPSQLSVTDKVIWEKLQHLFGLSQEALSEYVRDTRYGFVFIISTPILLQKLLQPFVRIHHQRLISSMHHHPTYHATLFRTVIYKETLIRHNMVSLLVDFATRFPCVLQVLLHDSDLWRLFCDYAKDFRPFNIDFLLSQYQCEVNFRTLTNSREFNAQIGEALGQIHSELSAKLNFLQDQRQSFRDTCQTYSMTHFS